MKKNANNVGGSANGVFTNEEKCGPSSWPIYAFVSTVSMACYFNGLNGDFVHDDIPAVVHNKDVIAANPLGHVFSNDFWGTPMSDINSHKSYRPLTTLTFRANYLCFGLEPIWFHVTNVLLHAAASSLFTRVCLYVARLKPPFATLAGLLFAVHPIHTEAVTGIVGRADVLAAVFFLISLLSYHGTSRQHYVWISVISGGLSMLAKETGITVFLVNFAYDFYKTWPNIRKTITEVRWTKETQQFAIRAIKLFVSLGLLLVFRLAMLQGSLPRFSQQDNPTAFHPSFLVRAMTFCHLAAFNWWLLLCPGTLSHDWQMGSVPLITTWSDSRNLVTAFFFLLLVLLVIKTLNDFENQRNVPVVLGLLLLVVPFLPATNLVVTVGFVIAERVLYIPSMGYILLIVHGLQIVWNSCFSNRQTIVCFVILLFATNCLRCVVRNRDWRSRETLLRAGIATLPNNAKMHYNFANFLRDSSRYELAESHYNTALSLWPTYASAHNNLGTLIKDQKNAEKHFLLAIRFSVNHLNAHYNLGQLYRKSNRTDESEQMLRKCLRINDRFTPAYIELARLRGPTDRNVGSLLNRVVQLNPRDPYYITLYAQWLLDKRNYLLALKYYWNALSVSHSYSEAVMGVTRILRKFGDHSRLFQIITRYHSILRLKNGYKLLNPHFYLHAWHLKSDLNSKSKAYDDRSPSKRLIFHHRHHHHHQQQQQQQQEQVPQRQPETSAASKWSTRSKHNKTRESKYLRVSKQCKSNGKKTAKSQNKHVIVHHMLETILNLNSISMENIKYTIQ